MKTRRIGRVVVKATAAIVALVAIVGLLHTPAGLRLLASLGVRCPMKASPAQTEQARRALAASMRGPAPAPARPALGFVLDATTRADVDAWAAAHGAACKTEREGTLITCEAVAAGVFANDGAPVDLLALQFSPVTGRLVNLTTLRRGLTTEDAARQLSSILSQLDATLGAPQIKDQPVDPATLTVASTGYRFRDYIADCTAIRVHGSVALEEHYMSARD